MYNVLSFKQSRCTQAHSVCALPHCCKCKYLPWYFCFFLFCSLFVCCYILDFRVTTDECAPHRNITMLILDSQKPFFFLLLLLDFSHGWIALTANAFNALPISMNSALNRNCNKNATSRTVKVHKGAADKSMLQQQKNINVFFYVICFSLLMWLLVVVVVAQYYIVNTLRLKANGNYFLIVLVFILFVPVSPACRGRCLMLTNVVCAWDISRQLLLDWLSDPYRHENGLNQKNDGVYFSFVLGLTIRCLWHVMPT